VSGFGMSGMESRGFVLVFGWTKKKNEMISFVVFVGELEWLKLA
jgi:hypothetical protein